MFFLRIPLYASMGTLEEQDVRTKGRWPKGKPSVLTGLAKIRKYRALDERGIEEEEEKGKTINKEKKYL